MNFAFSEEQEQLREQARRLLSHGRESARAMMEGDDSYDQALWQQCIEMGWPAAAIAEEHGGLGLSALELCVLAEEFGRSLAPVPFASSVLFATEGLKLVAGQPAVQQALADLACGEIIATVALGEAGQHGWDGMPSAKVENGRLTGCKVMVSDAHAARLAIVSAVSTDDAPGFGWWLVNLDQPGVTRRSVQSIDRIRQHADIDFDQAHVERLGEPGQGAELSNLLLNKAAILTAFEQLGAADVALEMTIEYVQTRRAFNQSVGSYQGVKHKLADMYVKNQLARSHCYFGAWALSAGPEALAKAAAGARLAATDALCYAGEEAVELHGGIGFTWESDIQLYYRRARLHASQLGGRADWARRLTLALARERT